MGLFRRPRRSPGIRLRISTQNGVVLETDSAQLHYMARYAKYGDHPCTPACEPGHEWLNLIAGGDHGALEFTQVPVKIEIQPAILGDPDG